MTTRWKLQMQGPHGWGDVKVSTDGEHYVPDYYDTQAKAKAQVREWAGEGGIYRAVPANHPSDYDFYSCHGR